MTGDGPGKEQCVCFANMSVKIVCIIHFLVYLEISGRIANSCSSVCPLGRVTPGWARGRGGVLFRVYCSIPFEFLP